MVVRDYIQPAPRTWRCSAAVGATNATLGRVGLDPDRGNFSVALNTARGCCAALDPTADRRPPTADRGRGA